MNEEEFNANSVVYVTETDEDQSCPNVITEVDSIVSKAKATYDVAVTDPGVVEGTVGTNHLALAIGLPTVVIVGLAVGVGVSLLKKKKKKLEVVLESAGLGQEEEARRNVGE